MENSITFNRNSKTATVTVNQGRYVKKIREMAEQFPDKVQIISDECGVVTATIPTKAVKLSIRERTMTDEQRKAASDRLKAAREALLRS